MLAQRSVICALMDLIVVGETERQRAAAVLGWFQQPTVGAQRVTVQDFSESPGRKRDAMDSLEHSLQEHDSTCSKRDSALTNFRNANRMPTETPVLLALAANAL